MPANRTYTNYGLFRTAEGAVSTNDFSLHHSGVHDLCEVSCVIFSEGSIELSFLL